MVLESEERLYRNCTVVWRCRLTLNKEAGALEVG